MEVTITEDHVKRAIEAYERSHFGHMETCPIAQALKDAGLSKPGVSYTEVAYTSNGKRHYRGLTIQAINFAEEFDDWFRNEYTEGRLGNFAGRTIRVWED